VGVAGSNPATPTRFLPTLSICSSELSKAHPGYRDSYWDRNVDGHIGARRPEPFVARNRAHRNSPVPSKHSPRAMWIVARGQFALWKDTPDQQRSIERERRSEVGLGTVPRDGRGKLEPSRRRRKLSDQPAGGFHRRRQRGGFFLGAISEAPDPGKRRRRLCPQPGHMLAHSTLCIGDVDASPPVGSRRRLCRGTDTPGLSGKRTLKEQPGYTR
jgi:hypothetical protein